MLDREANRALLNVYHNSIMRYQKLLETHLTEIERDYIKERLSACRAAVKALIGTESTTAWTSYRARSRQRTVEVR